MVSKKVWMVGFVAVVLGTSAYATPGNNGGGNGGCGVGQQTNGCGGSAGGAGGAGGQGGAGGSGVGIGIAGASANAAAVAAQQQGQIQGQIQGQSTNVRNENNLYSTNQNSNQVNSRNTNQATGGNAHASSGGNVLTQQGGAVTVEGDTYIAPAQERNPVATAYAPNVSPTALCALGVSGGAQGASFGVSFGGSYTDENCVLLEQVRTTAAILKDSATAAEMMCGLPAYKAARARTGKPCADADGKRAEAILEDRPVAAASSQPLNLLP
jgi:hypothetical protein